MKHVLLILMAFAAFARAVRGEACVRDGLLLNWDAQDVGKGAKAVPDSSGNGNPGAILGPGRIADKPPRIELDSKAALVGPKPLRPRRLSLEAVFRVDRVYSAGLQLIFTTYRPGETRGRKPSGNPRQWVLEIRGAPPQRRSQWRGHLSFGVFGEDGQWHFALSDRPITRGWHHALGTFDGRRTRLYLDGQAQSLFHPHPNGQYRGRVHAPPDDAIRLPAVGVPSPKGLGGLDGAIAFARLYDRGLSADEAARNWRYAQSLGIRFGPKEAPIMNRPKAPFKVLFSNDTTNILTCVSPYHAKGQPFSEEMLKATIDEAKGVDVHMLQPGLGWIPFWKSKQYPIEEHAKWFRERTGRGLSGYGRYLLAGGDIVRVFVDHCRKTGVVPFISYRLNDGHHLESVDKNVQRAEWCSKFYTEHPEYRLGPDRRSWDQHVQNWAIQEVRDHKFGFIREICEQYDIDGLELDFMRHCKLFRAEETTFKERSAIVAGFVRRVRELLDRTAKPGQHRWLCARVPFILAAHDDLGIDLPAMAAAGLDMVNLSAYYYTNQQSDMATICGLVPNAAVYLEMTHCTTTGPSRGGYDSFSYLRTADEQFYTGAHLAYARGAAGVSLFNFVYYREHGTPGRGPFNEPPFHVLPRLGQPEWLAQQPQWYVLAKAWYRGGGRPPLPAKLGPGQGCSFELDMAPNPGKSDGLFRLRTTADSRACKWTVTINRRQLAPAAYVRKPLNYPYEAALGAPSQYACFTVPRAILRNGYNGFRIEMEAGRPVTVDYVDVVLP